MRCLRAVGMMLALGLSLVACGSRDGMSQLTSSSTTTSTSTSTTPDAPPTSVAPASSTPASTSAPVPTTTSPPAAGPLEGVVVVVDPGHNGGNGSHPTEINRLVDAGGFLKACNTTGTAAAGLTESRFNWEVAQRLRTELEAQGATVVLTRTSDDGWGPCIDERGLTAANAGADVLVSIHADGADAGATGFHVITPAASGVVSQATSDASARLAADLRDAMVAQGFTPATYVGSDGIDERPDLGTLNRATVPAVMLESGNMRNPADLEWLASSEGQQRIALALAAAVANYLR